ncbi:FAS1-like dehydratase domain-containing protein [Dinoroseobacter sp. S124A]|uniref:FAS1-like dehydratase domain-containing protein n=1 Tax=Dinoroseobacter sp. S124A TaxID=3415128 RepID=UPI003C7D56B3
MDGSQTHLGAGADPTVDLTDWVGRSETVTGCVPHGVVTTIHATLARADLTCPGPREVLPPLWHWYAFPPAVGMADLAEDGHPKLGGFLPPVPYERRMWASGALSFHGDLRVGEEIEKTSTITRVDEKHGSTGGMVFVELAHELRGAGGLAIHESQTIVYLPIAPQFTPPPKKPGLTGELVIDTYQPVSTALLFRYSAITFNAHRIHYDLPYAQEIEHYPGLVVHGPLQANLLMAEACAWRGRRPDRFRFRGVHPMFHDSDMRLCAQQSGAGCLEMCTTADGGHRGMTATAEWEE